MLLFLSLVGCATDPVEANACEAVETGELHALATSTDAGLEEAGAQFHPMAHHHTLELDGPAWIWTAGGGEALTLYTDATLVSMMLDGADEMVMSGTPNSLCEDVLPNAYDVTLTDGTWDFQVDGEGSFSWIASPHDAHGDDHEH